MYAWLVADMKTRMNFCNNVRLISGGYENTDELLPQQRTLD